ncbi:MAG TPA: nuclear transport factor 2 family protein [Gemmataceae bacterium]|nr:nuclear transport factor 2 family protein [Gemmataceae bacterium]
MAKKKRDRSVNPVQIVTEWYEKGVIPKNMEVVLEHLHKDIEWWCFGPPGYRTNGYYKGHAGAEQFFKNLEATLDATSFKPHEYHGAGNVVTAVGLEKGKIRQWGTPESNQPFFNYWVHMFYFEGDKIKKFRANYTVIKPKSVPSPLE